jgi:hypothetical protein
VKIEITFVWLANAYVSDVSLHAFIVLVLANNDDSLIDQRLLLKAPSV